ncbi:hypothetical protein JZ751_011167, partial [Albula glossodonta]
MPSNCCNLCWIQQDFCETVLSDCAHGQNPAYSDKGETMKKTIYSQKEIAPTEAKRLLGNSQFAGIVKGVRYILEVQILRTVCRKNTDNPDLNNCHFQPKGKLHESEVFGGDEGDGGGQTNEWGSHLAEVKLTQ